MSEPTFRQCQDEWDASYEGAERALLDFALSATPAQRLAWLEQAIEFAFLAGALPLGDDDQGGKD